MTTTESESTPENIDIMLIEVVAKTKPKRVKAAGTAVSRAWGSVRAWSMGGNVD